MLDTRQIHLCDSISSTALPLPLYAPAAAASLQTLGTRFAGHTCTALIIAARTSATPARFRTSFDTPSSGDAFLFAAVFFSTYSTSVSVAG